MAKDTDTSYPFLPFKPNFTPETSRALCQGTDPVEAPSDSTQSEKKPRWTCQSQYLGQRDALGKGGPQLCLKFPTGKEQGAAGLWLAGHTEQTFFYATISVVALLPGIWDICRKSGPVCGIRSHLSWRAVAVD